jgi:hypothetical protein
MISDAINHEQIQGYFSVFRDAQGILQAGGRLPSQTQLV